AWFSPNVSAQQLDVRVIIDVSGSMKANDPHNLRVPAVNLLVELFPDGTTAGIWTFARFVDMPVPHDQVGPQWRRTALAKAKRIHSRGLFTDIEAVLTKATRNWKTPDAERERHLILLTDGVVDIPAGERASSKSRERILAQILPTLKATGAKIHTVGLSDNVDKTLLRELSVATNGHYAQVHEASELQRVFLKLFEQTAQADTVPLIGNAFSIDPAVSEVTLVVFRVDADSPATQIVSPQGKKFGAKNAPKNVRWRSDESYDLITMTSPTAGQWRIDAALDPDNRAMIVTDLKLRVEDLPAFLTPGSALELTAHLTEGKTRIARSNFLDKLVFVASTHPRGEEDVLTEVELTGTAPDNGTAKPGEFTGKLTPEVGALEVLVRVDGGTFVRERRHLLLVEWPAVAYLEFAFVPNTLGPLEQTDSASGAPNEAERAARDGPLTLAILAKEELVALESLEIQAQLVSPSGTELTLDLEQTGAAFRAPVPPPDEAGEYKIVVLALGKTTAGEPFSVALEELSLPGLPVPQAPLEPAPTAALDSEAEAATPVVALESVSEEAPDPPRPDPQWLMSSLIAVGTTILVIAAFALGWVWTRKRARAEMDMFFGAVAWSK
ncbi:MAG: hypothetical protein ACI9W2_002928, partial [Gammaproteobacteria bacterium]